MVGLQEAPIPTRHVNPVAAQPNATNSTDDCNQTVNSVNWLSTFHTLGKKRTFEKGEVIFREYDTNDYVFLILSGLIRGSKVLADGRRLLTHLVRPGQLLEHDQQPQCLFTAEAVTHTTAISIRKKQFDRAIAENPDLQALLMQTLLNELRATRLHVLALGRLSAIERVAQFLDSLWKVLAKDTDGAVEIPFSRADIADHLGLTIETVSRLFTVLRREGWIKLLDQSRFIILDEDCFTTEFLEGSM